MNPEALDDAFRQHEMVLELAPQQAGLLAAAAEAAGYGAVAVHADLAGRDRVLVAHRPAGPTGSGPPGGGKPGSGCPGEWQALDPPPTI